MNCYNAQHKHRNNRQNRCDISKMTGIGLGIGQMSQNLLYINRGYMALCLCVVQHYFCITAQSVMCYITYNVDSTVDSMAKTINHKRLGAMILSNIHTYVLRYWVKNNL